MTTGINDYVNIEIKSGIKEGDIIVTSKVNASSTSNYRQLSVNISSFKSYTKAGNISKNKLKKRYKYNE